MMRLPLNNTNVLLLLFLFQGSCLLLRTESFLFDKVLKRYYFCSYVCKSLFAPYYRGLLILCMLWLLFRGILFSMDCSSELERINRWLLHKGSSFSYKVNKCLIKGICKYIMITNIIDGQRLLSILYVFYTSNEFNKSFSFAFHCPIRAVSLTWSFAVVWTEDAPACELAWERVEVWSLKSASLSIVVTLAICISLARTVFCGKIFLITDWSVSIMLAIIVLFALAESFGAGRSISSTTTVRVVFASALSCRNIAIWAFGVV